MVSSPGPCVSSGGRLPEARFTVFLWDSKGAGAFFMVFQLDSKGVKMCKSCRSRQELSNEYYLKILASVQPRTGLSKFAKKEAKF